MLNIDDKRRNSFLSASNQAYLENQLSLYLQDKNAVSAEWQTYFAAIDIDVATCPNHSAIKQSLLDNKKATINNHLVNSQYEYLQLKIHDFIYAYRLLGHLVSDINPLLLYPVQILEELTLEYYDLQNCPRSWQFDVGGLAGRSTCNIDELVACLQQIYSNKIASEWMHIPDTIERQWVQQKIENNFSKITHSNKDKLRFLKILTAAEGLEKYLGSQYPGAKRFSLEGCDSLLVALDSLISQGGADGIQEIILGMAHRGRLNVLVNVLGKMPSELFAEFEGTNDIKLASGDVKYHQGFSADIQTEQAVVHLALAFNPSHLEIVTPVVSGSVRARQMRRSTNNRWQVLPIAIHGDAAFAGQGVVMETLNMSQTRGYSTGGTIHIIVNNQVGFTTSCVKDARSTLYCSDIGKMILSPIFHVNADEPEEVAIVVKLALEYRNRFAKDVIIDLIGYRRHGHNEADEPAATQPLMYQDIRKHPTVLSLYLTKLIEEKVITQADANQMQQDYRALLDKRHEVLVQHAHNNHWRQDLRNNWNDFKHNDWRIPVKTAIDINILTNLANTRDSIPDKFNLHARVAKIVADRQQMTSQLTPTDWGYAETLAYASLLADGFSVRLSGQDCGRGTFFHRHAVWHCQTSGKAHVSLNNLATAGATFNVIDSLLSEAAVLGFEYGYATSEPRCLVIWEAQFGDFANSAQVVIDQFISSGEQKWGRLNGLVMFLPHGYEGQGPEHSSARLERYLQLCAEHNIQVCVPSSPAQIFHLLRRQMLRPMRKPLIVITPKSLLRHKLAVSDLSCYLQGHFETVIVNTDFATHNINKIVLCSGKIYYELIQHCEKIAASNLILIRIEQLYPFPDQELAALLANYRQVATIVWCQEEPQNQGAWNHCRYYIEKILEPYQKLHYTGRKPSASPAVGYHHLHQQQQIELIVAATQGENT